MNATARTSKSVIRYVVAGKNRNQTFFLGEPCPTSADGWYDDLRYASLFESLADAATEARKHEKAWAQKVSVPTCWDGTITARQMTGVRFA